MSFLKDEPRRWHVESQTPHCMVGSSFKSLLSTVENWGSADGHAWLCQLPVSLPELDGAETCVISRTWNRTSCPDRTRRGCGTLQSGHGIGAMEGVPRRVPTLLPTDCRDWAAAPGTGLQCARSHSEDRARNRVEMARFSGVSAGRPIIGPSIGPLWPNSAISDSTRREPRHAAARKGQSGNPSGIGAGRQMFEGRSIG